MTGKVTLGGCFIRKIHYFFGNRAGQPRNECLLLCASAHQKQLFLRPSSIRANDKVLTIANYIDPCERICGSCERNVSMRTALIFKLKIYS